MAILTTYNGPYGGINVSAPDIIIAPTDSPAMQNVILRQNFLASRPPFVPDILPAFPEQCTGIASYLSTGSNEYICLGFSDLNVYELATNAANWGSPNALPAPALYNPVWVGSIGNLYYVNGSPYVLYNLAQQATNLFGARYIFELAGSLIIADTFEPTELPYRVRWCESGEPTHWDPGTYVGAGFNDLFDVSDVITGSLSLGSVAYLLRANGITQVTPTGNGIQPFDFNHLWAAEHGIGQFYPQGCAVYGSVGFILAFDNIYTFTVSSFSPIATKVMENIIADITNAGVNPVLFSWALPKKYNNVLYMTYELAIVHSDGTIFWSYSTKDQNWMRHTSPIQLTAAANIVRYKVNI